MPSWPPMPSSASSPAATTHKDSVPAHNRYNASTGDGDGVGMVNALHERIGALLAPFNGVSTRRLQRYLWWFCWTEQVRRSDASRAESLRAHPMSRTAPTRSPGPGSPTSRSPSGKYWESRAPEVTEDDLWGPEAMSILV